jgi:hypothetical protein
MLLLKFIDIIRTDRTLAQLTPAHRLHRSS